MDIDPDFHPITYNTYNLVYEGEQQSSRPYFLSFLFLNTNLLVFCFFFAHYSLSGLYSLMNSLVPGSVSVTSFLRCLFAIRFFRLNVGSCNTKHIKLGVHAFRVRNSKMLKGYFFYIFLTKFF